MNNQEAFNGVWQWFVVERHEVGMDSLGVCQYYISDDIRCAIGCLLPVDQAKLSSGIITALLENYKSISNFFLSTDPRLLLALQRAHDDSSIFLKRFNAGMTLRLRKIAREFELEVPNEDAEAVEELLSDISWVLKIYSAVHL